ncbi:MAG: hypothetical protein KKE17_01345 [Proteobacteria bacterium]|nr:hypothetical protein [Pseudomonadota bacterium]
MSDNNRFKRFEIPEIVLHWAQGTPFLILLISGGLLLASRFYNMDAATYHLLTNIHKTTAVSWVSLTLVSYLLVGPKLHLANLKEILTWGLVDIKWMVNSFRSLYNSAIEIPDAGKFNTGQKINCLLVMGYFFGFALTGFLMWFRGTILVSWYLHASLFFAALSSVSGHLYLSFINPSTRVGLGGIFHGWVPKSYIEHHHALSLPEEEREETMLRTMGFTEEQRKGEEEYHKKAVGSSMKAEIIFLITTLVLGVVGLWVFGHGQEASLEKGFNNIIRPRELSGAHQTKEIQGNCTKCHDYTGDLKDENCLACHKIIKERLDAKSGFHGTFGESRCRHCHKEHPKLKKSSIIPFDPEKFDHTLAMFKREGKHADKKIKCDDCHRKKRKKAYPGVYYMGLKFDSCADCHTDPHKSNLGDKCETCHTNNAWQGEELKFDHNRDSKFKLEGKHEKAKCIGCHKPDKQNAPLGTAVFRGLKIKCANCHKDLHNSQFGDSCQSCHTIFEWKGKELKFDHNLDSKYKLEGKHATAKCIDCHKPPQQSDPLAAALFRGLKQDCAACHKDPHKSNLGKGTECKSCHNFKDWKGNELKFDHNYDSKYRLKGKHAKIKCIECHKPASKTDPLASALFRGLKSECIGCHKDPHNQKLGDDCLKCHDFKGWGGDNLKFVHNDNSKYILEGKHARVDCKKCHNPQPDNKAPLGSARFKDMKYEKCDDCHQDPHKGEYGAGCLACHSVESFPPKKADFNHDRHTKYALEGRHAQVKCIDCHNPRSVKTLGPITLAGFKNDCGACHKDFHDKLLGEDCKKCHSPLGWKGKNLLFNHNVHSRYQIDNLHVKAKCTGCHYKNYYKPLKTACEDCHPQGSKVFVQGSAEQSR